MKVLITGGAGYIGSHTIVALGAAGHETMAVDNFCNSSPKVFDRLEQIIGQPVPYYELDVRDKSALEKVFDDYKPDAVIHFAALKSVGESVAHPLDYYQNNLGSTLTLLEVMASRQVYNLVFSSSATVYGDPETVPIREDAVLNATNPYGQTKLMNEQILRDLATSDSKWQITLLRYFNPAGADPSGLIGEDPQGVPSNLLPYIAQVAVGKLDKLRVFGDDYDTIDGTGVRDYIHVSDLAVGHVAALSHAQSGVATYNLGTGYGYSVLEMVAAFEKASSKNVNYEIMPRRLGDIASCYADPSKATKELGWEAKKTLDEMCVDAWRWQSTNPNGYSD